MASTRAKRCSWKLSSPDQITRATSYAGLGAVGESLMRHVQPLLVVEPDLARPAGSVLDRRAMSRIDLGWSQPLEPRQRLEVAPERIEGRVLPAPYVRRDLLEQDVTAEQASGLEPMEDDVAVGVAREEQYLVRLARLQLVSFHDEVRRPHRSHRQPDLLGGRRGGEFFRHAVRAQEGLERGSIGALSPGGFRQLRVERSLDDLGRARELGQRGRRAQVVGVVVRHDDPADGAAELVQRGRQRSRVPGVPRPQSTIVQPSAEESA